MREVNSLVLITPAQVAYLLQSTNHANMGHMTDTTAERVSARISIHRGLPAPTERRRLRETAGLTKTELAQAIGVTRPCIAFWENGERTPSGAALERYVTALDVLREAEQPQSEAA
jgi:DNA-binding transcriptional regulator YiaG